MYSLKYKDVKYGNCEVVESFDDMGESANHLKERGQKEMRQNVASVWSGD